MNLFSQLYNNVYYKEFLKLGWVPTDFLCIIILPFSSLQIVLSEYPNHCTSQVPKEKKSNTSTIKRSVHFIIQSKQSMVRFVVQ